MPQIVEVKTYKYQELSPKAKEKARSWYRDATTNDQWWEFDDIIACAVRLGIDIDQTQRKSSNGAVWYETTIYFSGFSSQGDGACFEGRWRWNDKPLKDAPQPTGDPAGSQERTRYATFVEAIAGYAPTDEKLAEIAARLDAFEGFSAKVVHSGHYSHEGCTDISVFDDKDGDGDEAAESDQTKEVREALRSFMRWIYRQLEEQYRHAISVEATEEQILANDYDFLVDGERSRF